MNTNDDAEREALERLLAAEALHARDHDDADDRALLSALAEHPESARDLASYRDAAAQLGLGVDPVEPPPSMKEALFAKLDDPPVASGPMGHRAGPTAVRPRRRRMRRPARALLVAGAALVTAVAIFFAGGLVFGGLGPTSREDVAIDETLAQILAADDVARAQADVEGGGRVTVYWSAELARSALVAQAMPEIPATNDYELWYIDEAGATSAGLLVVSPDGGATTVLDGTFVPGVAIGLTIEPKGGSDQPTDEPIAVVQSG